MKYICIKRDYFLIKLWLFFVFLSLFLTSTSAATLVVEAPSTIYKWCIQPYIIKMDTNWIATRSIDTKLFLMWYFSIHNPYVDFSSALSNGQIYANYIPGIFDTTNIQTWVASSWDYAGWQYLYINSSQLGGFWAPVTGNNKLVATLYLKASNFDTWYLDFYYVTGWNGDDSNISSGINEWTILGTYTLYEDALFNVVNLERSFSSNNVCGSMPYIDSATYRQTWYISTDTWVQSVWTSVIAWPIYSGTSNWTVWTKEKVTLTFTGISDSYNATWWLVRDSLSIWIRLTNVSALNSPYLLPINSSVNQTGWNKQYYQVLITGNVSTWFVWFDNVLWNTGYSYKTGWNNYWNIFNIDVFWIDTVGPVNTWYFTWYIYSTWLWITNYILNWSNFEWHVSSPILWFHANWTDMDDQYKVIWFSGTNSINQNCVDLWYPCTNIWYMQYLNATWYVRSINNKFKLLHNIIFTNSFSGYITVIDRAGNTWEWYVDIDMDDLIEVNYGIIAYTESVWSRVTNNLSGMLLKLAIYSGWFNKEWLLGSGLVGIELVYTGWVKTSATWWSSFTGNFASWQYRVLAEWVNTLSYLISGVNLNPQWWLIDFGSVYSSWFKFWDLNNILTQWSIKYANYNFSSIREQIINVSDLATLITIWAPWNPANYESWSPELWVYTWSLFVDIPNWNRINVYNNLLLAPIPEQYMQYHPYDVDANGQVNVNDYNILFGNLWWIGMTYWWRLSGPGSTNATMPF